MNNKELQKKAENYIEENYIEENYINKNTYAIEKAFRDGAKMILKLGQTLPIDSVSNRRELLNSFLDWEDERTSGKLNDREQNNNYISEFLKTL